MDVGRAKTETIPIIVGALGGLCHILQKGNLKKILKNLKESSRDTISEEIKEQMETEKATRTIFKKSERFRD